MTIMITDKRNSKKSRALVERHRTDYAKVLRIDLPNLEEWEDADDHYFEVGVNFYVSEKELGLPNFVHAFYWERGESGEFEPGVYAGVYPNRIRNLNHLAEIVRQKKISPNMDDEAIWYGEKIAITCEDSIDSELEMVMEKWMDLWRKVGGIRALAGDGKEVDQTDD